MMMMSDEELDGSAVSALGVRSRMLSNVIVSHRRGDQNLLSRAPPCFEKQVKPLVPAAFVVVSTHQLALGPRGGLRPVLLICNL
jgi:hypothetical protein